MKRKKTGLVLLAFTFSFACEMQTEPEVYQYEDIVKRLYTPEFLAESPVAGEKSGSVTSYNRASKYNEQTDQYEAWYANKDGDFFLRKEGSDIVAAEITGPGVIWRVWSAKPQEGLMKIFIDGREEPVLDIPFLEFFDSSSDLFPYPSLVHRVARGYNNFVPIPFQESIKITFGEGWGRFFQFTYTTFPEGTVVPSFGGEFNAAEKEALATANRILSGKAKLQRDKNEVTEIEKQVTVAPGQTIRVSHIEGARAINSFRVKPRIEEEDDTIHYLRELALSMTWDNGSEPGVWSPLGDFFGSAPGINNYKSFLMGMTDEGFYSNWYMPFAKEATIELTNDGTLERQVTFHISHIPLKKNDGELLRFHAKWHRDAYPGVDKERYLRGDRWPDWPFLITRGKGRFCGVSLNLWNPNPKGVLRRKIPRDQLKNVPEEVLPMIDSILKRYWWGEGDEKFFVDGEKFPSTYGTGTEDYFGYAWCTPKFYESAFQNQPLNVRNRGHVSVNRVQIADNVPFMSSFEGCLEKYHPNEWPLLYSCVAYWYLAPGGQDPYGPVDVDERVDYYTVPEPTE